MNPLNAYGQQQQQQQLYGGQRLPMAMPAVRAAAPPAEEPLHRQWSNAAWPANQITRETALDYFCHDSNFFYDRRCLNQHLRMQRQDLSKLDSMQGMAYVLVDEMSHEPLFVIRKQWREADNVTPLAYYYVVAGNVFQAPDVHSVVSARLASSLNSLRKSFDIVKDCVRYTSSGGYEWDLPKDETLAADDAEEDKPAAEDTRSTLYQRTRTDRLLGLLADRFAPAAAQPPPVDDAVSESSAPSAATATAAAAAAPPVAKRPRVDPHAHA